MALGHRSKESSKSHNKLEFFNLASGNWTTVSCTKLDFLNISGNVISLPFDNYQRPDRLPQIKLLCLRWKRQVQW